MKEKRYVILFFLLFYVLIAWQFYRIYIFDQKQMLVDKIIQGNSALHILTIDYLNKQADRARLQWFSRMDKIEEQIRNPLFKSFEFESYSSIKAKQEEIKKLFYSLIISSEEMVVSSPALFSGYKEANNALASRILVESQSLMEEMYRIERKVNDSYLFTRNFTILTLFIFSIITGFSIYFRKKRVA